MNRVPTLRRLYVIIALIMICQLLQGQYSRHIVRFTNKNGTPNSISNPSAFLSQKALDRRTRQNISIDSTDLPVVPAYLDSLRSVPNVEIVNKSKWLNQVLIRTTDPAALSRISAFPFVAFMMPIASRVHPVREEIVNRKFESVSPIPSREMLSERGRFDLIDEQFNYGATFNQLHIHEGEYLHQLGFTGKGITIAVLDAGFFGYKTNPALDSVRLQGRILGEYDYVLNEMSVNEDHPHGLYCFSIMAANVPGSMVGSAPHSSFWLFRTEDVATEYPVEEQNWAVAAEAADSLGADMISSSLGYVDFDDPSFNHSYAERDGNTCISTKAADLAARKGMIVVNSAGNSGGLSNDNKFVGCPADGDSVVAVGAVDNNGQIAGFSSWGPNGAGKIKPNIVSVGQGTIVASTGGTPIAGNGTSFSAPNAAGLIACLWQAFPDFTNMEIVDAVQRSSHRYDNPDGRFGYGIPNFRIAYELLLQQREVRNASRILGDQWIKAYPVPFVSTFNILIKAPKTGRATLRLLDIAGRLIDQSVITINQDQVQATRFSRSVLLSRGVYFVHYDDGTNRQVLRIVKN